MVFSSASMPSSIPAISVPPLCFSVPRFCTVAPSSVLFSFLYCSASFFSSAAVSTEESTVTLYCGVTLAVEVLLPPVFFVSVLLSFELVESPVLLLWLLLFPFSSVSFLSVFPLESSILVSAEASTTLLRFPTPENAFAWIVVTVDGTIIFSTELHNKNA